ncbi:MAG: hypothetical protein LBU32_14525 [Clostridiales bacterium]|nr:hypothetical protein [Clostridiales bacterium]
MSTESLKWLLHAAAANAKASIKGALHGLGDGKMTRVAWVRQESETHPKKSIQVECVDLISITVGNTIKCPQFLYWSSYTILLAGLSDPSA